MAISETNLGRVSFVLQHDFDPLKANYKKLDVVIYNNEAFAARKDYPAGLPSGPDWMQISYKGRDGILSSIDLQILGNEIYLIADGEVVSKITIPIQDGSYVQSDWSATDGPSMILNKPESLPSSWETETW